MVGQTTRNRRPKKAGVARAGESASAALAEPESDDQRSLLVRLARDEEGVARRGDDANLGKVVLLSRAINRNLEPKTPVAHDLAQHDADVASVR